MSYKTNRQSCTELTNTWYDLVVYFVCCLWCCYSAFYASRWNYQRETVLDLFICYSVFLSVCLFICPSSLPTTFDQYKIQRLFWVIPLVNIAIDLFVTLTWHCDPQWLYWGHVCFTKVLVLYVINDCRPLLIFSQIELWYFAIYLLIFNSANKTILSYLGVSPSVHPKT